LSITNELARINNVAAIEGVGSEDIDSVTGLDVDRFVASALVKLDSVRNSHELFFWVKIGGRSRRRLLVGSSRIIRGYIKIENECRFIPHLLPPFKGKM